MAIISLQIFVQIEWIAIQNACHRLGNFNIWFLYSLLCLLWVYSPFSWFLGWKLIDFRLTLISVITVNISLSTDLLVSHKFWCNIFSFSFSSVYFKNFSWDLLFDSWGFFWSLLRSFQVFGDFPVVISVFVSYCDSTVVRENSIYYFNTFKFL